MTQYQSAHRRPLHCYYIERTETSNRSNRPVAAAKDSFNFFSIFLGNQKEGLERNYTVLG